MLKKLICLISLLPIHSFADSIVLGHEGRHTDTKPLIIQKNSDAIWSKNTNISGLPANMNNASLRISSCSNNYCVAIGDYQNSENKSLPLIMLSKDHGKSWVFINKISGIPAYVNEVSISDLHCENNTCMAGGRMLYYVGSGSHQKPLLLISSNNGDSWSVSNAGTVNLMSKSEGQLNSIAKSGKNWMANGIYEYAPFPLPREYQSKFFMISKDDGATWKEVNIENRAIIPPARGVLFDLKCMNNICLQLGTDKDLQPLVARSEDNGNTWKIIKDISGGDTSSVDRLTCYNDFCVVADEQLIISHDKGLSWTPSQINNKPDDFMYSGIKQVSCYNDTMCTGIGWWRKKNYDDTFFPMVITTHDGGATWTYQDNPFIAAGNEFNSIQCTLNVCDIVGTKDDSYLILTSQDDGLTWTSKNEIIGLPSHSYSGLISFLNFV